MLCYLEILTNPFENKMEFHWKLAAGLTAAAATGAIATLAISELQRQGNKLTKEDEVPKKWIRVGAVSELILYPVKSCKGVNVHEATCTDIGLKGTCQA